MNTKSKIAGIGVDVVDVERMKGVLERQQDYFLNKIFSDMEVAYCKSRPRPYIHFAARFAAKEAVAKAMRTGWSGAFHWKDIEVVNDATGAPHILLVGEVARALKECKLHLSISHSDTTVVAFVVMEQM
ncbi:MAG: holo-ACP synthase [Ignavibacteriales bacterium]|nr:holo-ACP synthase [Ignavibacteriales bacterium]